MYKATVAFHFCLNKAPSKCLPEHSCSKYSIYLFKFLVQYKANRPKIPEWRSRRSLYAAFAFFISSAEQRCADSTFAGIANADTGICAQTNGLQHLCLLPFSLSWPCLGSVIFFSTKKFPPFHFLIMYFLLTFILICNNNYIYWNNNSL